MCHPCPWTDLLPFSPDHTTRSLAASGAEMTVETLLVVQHGYSFKGGQNYGAAKDVYRKVVPPQEHRSVTG